MGDCIMRARAYLRRKLHGGVIKEGDNLEILEEAWERDQREVGNQ